MFQKLFISVNQSHFLGTNLDTVNKKDMSYSKLDYDLNLSSKLLKEKKSAFFSL